MKKLRRSRLARLKASLATVAMAVSGIVIVALTAILWPVALLFAPIVLLLCWLVGVEVDDGMNDL